MVTNSVAVVTGGSTPLGLESAQLLAHDHHIVLSDESGERLNRALDQLDSWGVSAESIVADPTDADAVEVLMQAARAAGPVSTVVHAAGATSPSGSPEAIIRARVQGTITMTAATLAVAGIGTTLIHAAAVGPTSPLPFLPRWGLRLAPTQPEQLASRLIRLVDLGPARIAPAAAHALSGLFVDWYTSQMVHRFAAVGGCLHAVPADAIADLCRGVSRPSVTTSAAA